VDGESLGELPLAGRPCLVIRLVPPGTRWRDSHRLPLSPYHLPMDLPPGTVLADRFRVTRPAGAGGMGKVFLAEDLQAGTAVAIKVLASGHPALRPRFATEARVLAALSHPGIVRHVAQGETPDGTPYLVMEWVEGETLGARLRLGALPVGRTLRLGVRLAEALSAAHAAGVVHRDIKPANVVLPDGDVSHAKILDFGVARDLGRSPGTTTAGGVVGTPRYMAPEQARGSPVVDARADVFSLGCVLQQCLTGAPAFEGEDSLAIFAKILLEEPAPLDTLCPAAPPALVQLVKRMLAKDPEGRPADGGAVAAELDAIARETSLAREAGESPTVLERRVPAESPRRETTRTRVALGPAEQRVSCVVLAGPVLGGVAPTLEELQHVVDAHGARVDPLLDGGVLASLSGRGGATDLAARAAGAALALRQRLPGFSVAMATGRGVVAGRGTVGEVVDRAAHLVRIGPCAEGVRLDEVSAGLLDGRFEIVGDGGGLVLRAERAGAADPVRTVLGRPATWIGRERELDQLTAIFDECAGEPVARAVLVTGPAGIGKSRLLHELGLRLRAREGVRPEVLLARGDPVAVGSPFGMLASVVGRAAAVTVGEPGDVRWRKLRARVARHLEAPRQERVTELFAELLGIPVPAPSDALRAARADPLLMHDALRGAGEDFLAAECAAGPVVLALEDLQWGDLPTVRLVDSALRSLAEAPLLVLALGRPEVLTVFPGLWAERNVQQIRLAGLTRRSAERLVANVLGDTPPPDRLARLVERADGNPFVLEELVRAFADGKDDALPDSVLGLVQARLDTLGLDTRRALRAASILGRTFWSGGVEALLGGEDPRVEGWLAELEAREVVMRQPVSRFPGQVELSFRHDLVRDAAYRSLTDEDLVLGHALAADWLEKAGETDPLVLAEHLVKGAQRDRAARAFLVAAEEALQGHDLGAVATHTRRGIELGAQGELLGQIEWVQAQAARWSGGNDLVRALCRQALAHLPAGSDAWWGATGELSLVSERLGDPDGVDAIANEQERAWPAAAPRSASALGFARTAWALALAGRYARADAVLARIEDEARAVLAAEPTVAARVDLARAQRALQAGDIAKHLHLSEDARAVYDAVGDRRIGCLMRANLGYAYVELGDDERAAQLLQEAQSIAERLGLHAARALALQNSGIVLARRGQIAEAKVVELEAVESLRRLGDRRLEGAARAYLASILLQGDDLAWAEASARDAVQVLEASPPKRAFALGVLSRVLAAAGRAAEAMRCATDAVALLEQLGGIEEGEATVLLAHVEALVAAGEKVAAHAAASSACTRLRERAAQITDGALAASFLARVPENARLLRLESELAGG